MLENRWHEQQNQTIHFFVAGWEYFVIYLNGRWNKPTKKENKSRFIILFVCLLEREKQRRTKKKNDKFKRNNETRNGKWAETNVSLSLTALLTCSLILSLISLSDGRWFISDDTWIYSILIGFCFFKFFKPPNCPKWPRLLQTFMRLRGCVNAERCLFVNQDLFGTWIYSILIGFCFIKSVQTPNSRKWPRFWRFLSGYEVTSLVEWTLPFDGCRFIESLNVFDAIFRF